MEKMDSLGFFAGERDCVKVSRMDQEACFGEDERLQKPSPDLARYQSACSAVWAVIGLFEQEQPAFYTIWRSGRKDFLLALDGLEDVSEGKPLTSYYQHYDTNNEKRWHSEPGYEPLYALLRSPGSRQLFGDRAVNNTTVSGGPLIAESLDPMNELALEALDYFESLVQSYQEERERGQAILQEMGGKLSSAMDRLEEEYLILKGYFEEAQEFYQDNVNLQNEEERQASIDQARQSAPGRLWGEE